MPFFYGCTGVKVGRDDSYTLRYAGKEGQTGLINDPAIHRSTGQRCQSHHFLEAADASEFRTGFTIIPYGWVEIFRPEAIIRLADHPNIVIDKEAMGRPSQIAKIAAGKKGNFPECAVIRRICPSSFRLCLWEDMGRRT